MRKMTVLFMLAFVLLALQPAFCDYLANIQFSPTSPASFKLGDKLDITFDYNTSEAGGVRIFARPYSNGSLTPGYSAHGSPLYLQGSGSGTAWFTINTGNVVVDHIRFQMLDANQTKTILEVFIPVTYYFSPHSISNIQLNPVSPTSMPLNQNIEITFDYSTDDAGGVRIFARPFTKGGLSPNYAAHGSPLYPTGTGSSTGFFTITSGDVLVDSIRFRMLNADQSVVLLEFFVPVKYHFANHSISNIILTPNTPATMLHSQNVNISFDYVTNEASGVRIFARPYTSNAPTPDYAAHPSPVYATGKATGTGWFRITTGDVIVDQIYLKMTDANQTQVLFEKFIDVEYHYSTHAISNIVFSPTSPAYFTLNHNLDFTFDYSTDESSGVYIWGRPYSNGIKTPNYAAHGSPVYSVGSGNGSGFFTITSGEALVDQVQFKMSKSDQSQTFLEFYVPSEFHFGDVPITSLDNEIISSPAEFALEQNYPNPFNPTTNINFSLTEKGFLTLDVYNILGQKVKSLISENRDRGIYSVRWDGTDDDGGSVSSGIYLYRLSFNNQVKVKRMMLIR